MTSRGEKIAEGRAAEIFRAGPGRVVRVARGRCDYDAEALVMKTARMAGLAVPEVHDVSGNEMVMDLVTGPTMSATLGRKPWTLGRQAKTLAALHNQIHQVRVTPNLIRASPVAGDRLLHMDLHPANIILSPDGPVLIDWANAAVGDPGADLAMTWLLIATSEITGGRLERPAMATLRRMFVRAWITHIDKAAAERALGPIAALRAVDANVTPTEAANVRQLAKLVADR